MDSEPWRRRLSRSSRERMWGGVAGGLALYFDIDPTLMRLMWVVATVVTAGLFVAVYFVMWIIMPLDTEVPTGGWQASDRPPAPEPPPGPPPQPEAPPPGWEPAGGSHPFGRQDYWGYGPGYYHYGRKKRSAGIVLIVLGILFLSGQAGLFRWINWSVAWAVVLIAIGVALLMRHHDWRM
ncbi:MAG TPA: PspC domain-containing protein [Chloroflexota bacterium]|nr:PspC domain-containing protein [Chloroflexota bacterium]